MTTDRQAQLLADWLQQEPGSPPPPDLDPEAVEAIIALRPDLAQAARVSIEDVLAEVAEGPFAQAPARQEVQALVDWLEQHVGAEPPANLDPAVVEAVYALRPDLAPAPRVALDDILGSVTSGPFAAAAATDAPAEVPATDKVVAFPAASTGPDPAAAQRIADLTRQQANRQPPQRRRLPRWAIPGLGGLAVAAAALLVVVPGSRSVLEAPTPFSASETLSAREEAAPAMPTADAASTTIEDRLQRPKAEALDDRGDRGASAGEDQDDVLIPVRPPSTTAPDRPAQAPAEPAPRAAEEPASADPIGGLLGGSVDELAQRTPSTSTRSASSGASAVGSGSTSAALGRTDEDSREERKTAETTPIEAAPPADSWDLPRGAAELADAELDLAEQDLAERDLAAPDEAGRGELDLDEAELVEAEEATRSQGAAPGRDVAVDVQSSKAEERRRDRSGPLRFGGKKKDQAPASAPSGPAAMPQSESDDAGRAASDADAEHSFAADATAAPLPEPAQALDLDSLRSAAWSLSEPGPAGTGRAEVAAALAASAQAEQAGDVATAIVALQPLLADGDDAVAQDTAARIAGLQLSLGQASKALATVEIGLRRGTRGTRASRLYALRGQAWERLGAPESAAEAYQQALQAR